MVAILPDWLDTQLFSVTIEIISLLLTGGQDTLPAVTVLENLQCDRVYNHGFVALDSAGSWPDRSYSQTAVL